MKITLGITSWAKVIWGAAMFWVAILFLEKQICYMRDIQQEDGVGDGACCLPDTSVWMMKKRHFKVAVFRVDLLIILPFSLFLPG